ncbi:MAG TPA: electron transport complex subunit RsxC, partial [Elusimicrobia bacterium]|nr:electron transport complex subunit RsxC [Elusimicrobiota bacterium]
DNSNWNKTAEDLSAEKKLDIIKDNGIVGMGGAAFPTHVKFKPPKPIDTLILNGCECEPYLTGDYRIMLENTKEILHGTRILLNILNIQKAIIAIEDNKKDAYEKLVAENSDNKIEFVLIKTKYPQGAERMLIKKLLNREVPIGGLPLDVGVVVSNVSTVFAVYNAIINGTPLIERIITVSGKNCKKPGNYRVKIGTPIKNIIEHCFGTSESINKGYVIKMGGQMMGINLQNIEAPVIKGTTGIIVFEKTEIEFDKDRKCIKCGRCAEVCPMELYPMQYVLNFQLNTPQEAKKHDVKSCIECGCCEYICSSKIPIVSIVKQEKELC